MCENWNLWEWLHHGPNERVSFVRTDTLLIFPCFLEAWIEINALTITDSQSQMVVKEYCEIQEIYTKF